MSGVGEGSGLLGGGRETTVIRVMRTKTAIAILKIVLMALVRFSKIDSKIGA